MTASDKDCEDYARDCVRLANLTSDPKIRYSLMQMAREWMAVAMHENTVPEPKRRSPQLATFDHGPSATSA